MKHLRFTRSARRAISLLCLIIAGLLLYKHIAQEQRQSKRIEDLQTRIAALENSIAIALRPAETAPESIGKAPAPVATATVPTVSGTPPRDHTVRSSEALSRPGANTTPSVSTPSATHAATIRPERNDKNFPESAAHATSATSGRYQPKFKTPRVVELNTADSLTLVRIPGIGAATAGAILRYRSRLGGYASARQVVEAAHWASASQVDIWCRDWLAADTMLLVPLKINRADFSSLLRHPYLSYAQVCALCDWRRTHGRIRSLSELKLLPEFGESDLARLSPYLSFQ